MYFQKGGPFLEPDGGQLPLPSGREPALFRFMNDGKPYKPSVHDRLRSIALDVGFVRSVADANPLLAVVPNLRCGEWYAPPELAGGRQAYFKSTDGHTGEWDFSLRRANMHLLPLIEQAGGLILVDATRRGKRFPDALSKTIPLWCATLNRASVLRSQRRQTPATGSASLPPDEVEESVWRKEVIVPPQSVSRSEQWDIEQRIDGWAEKLLASSLPLPDLALPLRPVHVSPADPLPALAPAATLGFYPIVCLSASRFIASDDDRQMRGETLEDGSTTEPWRYEQGAGDDHELWSAGLTPADFWHKLPAGWERSAKAEVEQLAKAATKGPDSKPGLPSIAAALAEDSSRELATPNANTIDLVRPSAFVHLATLPLSSTTLDDYACIILSSSVGLPCPIFPEPSSAQRRAASDDDLGRPARHDQTLLVLPTKPPKAALPPPAALETAVAFAACSIARGQKVVVACEGGTDGSVGVGVVLLQALFDEKGIFRAEPSASMQPPSKATLSTRLQWAITARPRANPSRKTLQHVNQFFLSGAYRPASTADVPVANRGAASRPGEASRLPS